MATMNITVLGFGFSRIYIEALVRRGNSTNNINGISKQEEVGTNPWLTETESMVGTEIVPYAPHRSPVPHSITTTKPKEPIWIEALAN